MQVLVTGATGLIGSALLARLRQEGHEVVGVARNPRGRQTALAADRWIALDFAQATRPEDWLPHLAGIDAVVNCAGLLQDAADNALQAVHVDGVAALAEACARAGVRRLIHISAIGADRKPLSDFSRTKQEGETALMARDLDWVILRPSVVIGRNAYGGSALFRGLAAFPRIVPMMPETGLLQVVHMDDLLATIVFFLQPDAPRRCALDIAGPQRLSMSEIVRGYRSWLGFGPARFVKLPSWTAAIIYRFGDFVGWLGWPTPIRSTARREMIRGAIGDPDEWTRLTGIMPRTFAAALAAEPASVQERWFARLYLLKPLIFGVLALFWISTGILAIGPGYEHGDGLMHEGGAGAIAPLAIIGGGLLDLAIGAGIAYRRTTRIALLVSLAVSLLYAVIGTILVPRLWVDPLGPMMKIWPIMVLTVVALAIREDR